jgi:hypothetical protein
MFGRVPSGAPENWRCLEVEKCRISAGPSGPMKPKARGRPLKNSVSPAARANRMPGRNPMVMLGDLPMARTGPVSDEAVFGRDLARGTQSVPRKPT